MEQTPEGEIRQQRERTRYRMALSLLRTGVKNRVQAILHRFGILHDFSDLFGKAGVNPRNPRL